MKGVLDKIKAIFSSKGAEGSCKKPLKPSSMQMNLFLLNAVLKHIQKGVSRKPLSLFTTDILSSKNRDLEALIEQAQHVCKKQDIELFSYKEFYSRSKFSLRSLVQLNFNRSIKTKDQAEALIHKMQEQRPSDFKKHLITLLENEDIEIEQVQEEMKRLEKEWKFYAPGHGKPAPVSRVSPI
jgi:hypothetical protein